MSVKVTLFDGTEYVITNEEAEVVNAALASEQKYIQLAGNTFAISAIAHLDSLTAPAINNALPAPRKQNHGWDLPADFYSEERMAERRAENKIKYAPKSANSLSRDMNPAVNQAVELGDFRLESQR